MAQQLGNNYFNSPYKFNGKELDEETGFYYYGARYYDPKISIWMSVDPLAENAPSWSPYRYGFNNPVRYIDPTGMSEVDNPIYDTNGTLLGTDEKGLQGKAIIMDKDKFSQNMKHNDALKNNLGYKGLKSDKAKTNFEESYDSLSSRPDYDGVVTNAEAQAHWQSNNGGDLYVNIGNLDLSPLVTGTFNGDEMLRENFFGRVGANFRTSVVHGTLSMRLKNPITGEVGLFTDNNGNFDTYDFNSDGRLVRDMSTWVARRFVGQGTGFGFKPFGKNPRVQVHPK